ncbi:hypothetical protein KI387_002845, partial [Taxus chinensis]
MHSDSSLEGVDSMIKDVSTPPLAGHIPIKSIAVVLLISVDARNEEWIMVDRKKKGNTKSISTTILDK